MDGTDDELGVGIEGGRGHTMNVVSESAQKGFEYAEPYKYKALIPLISVKARKTPSQRNL